ncbi:MAG: gamma-glutamyl-gamma-aminobutyrate hydrolase family protein, partial [Chlamydiales bacterium]|nr:gamma-glutamyl-gamma-aminobutyrate hydrolase family protein [Chlamydiales bacterium]
YSKEDYDGLFISNGPGDPSLCQETITILRKALLRKKPIFGICLGAQLLALATGAKTYKLRFGHRGHNQPCRDLKANRCLLTSQNHGYAIDETSLPKDWKVSFRNMNDGSVEGISHKKLPYFAVQFHPESSPGPTDAAYLFETFYKML